MTPADGFRVKLVAAEPLVRKPVAIEFDDCGRLWVIQYLQYPNPAGLKRVTVDRYSRTVYDRIPEPPPHGPRGADRITILEDLDADGRARKAKDFVNGLNLATGLAFGHGGVFVLQAPYLLFYPDRNCDDIPDGNPDVLVSGFGIEDAHSVANSLTWGPDGWLYGCQGSTVTAKIRPPHPTFSASARGERTGDVEFQQGIWRYHPLTHRFELFCEGGGNIWGLDFDQHGNLLYSTNVGGYVVMHGVQGGYYWKQFGKHGALHNAYAYGYFDHVPHLNFRGGHVTVGGIVYQGDSFPDRFRGKYVAADLLGHNIYWHDLQTRGSTFRSAHGGDLLLSNDLGFAPSDLTLGPDGSVYVADWHDRRTAHPDPDAEWDRSKGRIYKIEVRGAKPASSLELTKRSSAELVQLLAHPNDWYVRKARRILADRRDPTVIFPLRTLILESRDDHLALEALWALYVSGGFDEELARKLLSHRQSDIRSWAVRFLGDEGKVSQSLGQQLLELAASEPDVHVRCQLASTAKRLRPVQGLAIVERLLQRDIDRNDPYIPLLCWWAVEHHAEPAQEQVLGHFTSAAAWQAPLIRDTILGRLMRRYAAEGTKAGYTACARLLASAPSASQRQRLLADLDQGLQDRPSGEARPLGTLFQNLALPQTRQLRARRDEPIPPALETQLAALWTDDTRDVTLLRLGMHLDRPGAQARVIDLVTNPRTPEATRLTLLQLLGETGKPDCVAALLHLLGGSESEAMQLAVLAALQPFNRKETTDALLGLYPRQTGRLRSRARQVLFSRKDSALAFLEGVEQGKYAAKEVPVDELRPLALQRDRRLIALVRKHWGNVTGGTPEEKLAEMRRLSNDLRAGSGDLGRGREVFRRLCASCHRLFDEGNTIGPDLTHANRKDRDYILVSIVDPSAVVRKEYLSYMAQTTDGRVLTGLLVEQTPSSITLLDGKNERTTIARSKLEALEESPVSLMPENLLKDLKPTELRDLFSYLQK
jgi:putative membrane-bound dehydrogenase-like protein